MEADDTQKVEKLSRTNRAISASTSSSISTTPQIITKDQELKRVYEKKIIELKAEQEYNMIMASLDAKEKKKIPVKVQDFKIKIDSYVDNVEQFWLIQPFFYDKSQIFWLWNTTKNCYERTDETDMMNLIDEQLGFAGQTITGGIRNNYLEAFKRVGRKHTPKNPNKTWVQFKDTIVDITSGITMPATPDYFITNPVPWKIGTTEETPTIDKLFQDWQPNNKKVLYEIISYCTLTDYPIHIIFTMIGTGRNGKTQYQKIIEKFLGEENITSAELDSLVKERFESAKLYKKLVCTMGETNFGTISQTSLLKKLCGGDLISYEFKNKMPFTSHNYAKIIINTNSLPASNDTTEGFYRRWLILNWENNFEESGKDIVDIIPDWEYENLAKKCIRVLSELLEVGHFGTQGSIEDRKQKYIMASNPITLFLQERCTIGDSLYIKAKDLYHEYLKYLQEKKRRIIKRKEFNQILAEEGFQAEHKDKKVGDEFVKSYWIEGLQLAPLNPLIRLSTVLSFPVYREQVGNIGDLGEKGGNLDDNSILGFESIALMIEERADRKIGLDTLVSYGVSEESIRKWIGEGLLYESPVGWINLV